MNNSEKSLRKLIDGMRIGVPRIEEKVSPERILLAEESEQMRSLLAWLLHQHGYAVTQCADGVQAAKSLGYAPGVRARRFFDLIVCDQLLPGITGLELLRLWQRREEIVPIILITASGNEKLRTDAMALGAAAVLNKPFTDGKFLRIVREVLPPQNPVLI